LIILAEYAGTKVINLGVVTTEPAPRQGRADLHRVLNRC
jgi:hypothetical protein